MLRLLATTLSGPEIAGRLFMSVNTFRTHTRHIFTKLDVNTRRGAVSRAGELACSSPTARDPTPHGESPTRSHRHVMWAHRPGS